MGTEQVTFYSKHTKLKLIYKPHVEQVTALGTVQTLQPGESILFEPGRGSVRIAEGETFSDGTSKLDWLRKHRGYNRRFFERGNEPDAIKPSLEEQVKSINRAVAVGSFGQLDEIEAGERETHNRETVLIAVENAREILTAVASEGPTIDDDPTPTPQAPADEQPPEPSQTPEQPPERPQEEEQEPKSRTTLGRKRGK